MTYDEALNIINASISAVITPSKHRAADKAILDYASGLVANEEFGPSWADAVGWAPSAAALYDKISSISSNDFESALTETEGVVKWQGTLTENTTIDAVEWDLIFEVGGVPAIDVSNRLLKYSDGNVVVDWSGGYLRDASENSSVAWKDRVLNLGGIIVVDWSSAYYNDSDGNPMLRNHCAFATTGERTIDFENGRLEDYSGIPSVSWAENDRERCLISSTNDISINWQEHDAFDVSSILSFNWDQRELYNSAEVAVLNWGAGVMYRTNLDISIDWESSILYSADAVISLDYEGHILWNQDQQDFIDYSGDEGILVLESTTKAFLPPRMTTAQKNAIPTPGLGSIVIDTTLGKMCLYGPTGWETLTSI